MTTILLRRATASSFGSRYAAGCIPTAAAPASASSSRRPSTTGPRRPSTTDYGGSWLLGGRPPISWYRDQVARYDASLPLEEASTPPSSWYAHFHDLEREAVFFNGWIAASVSPVDIGDYATGEVLGQPYLLTRGTTGDDGGGDDDDDDDDDGGGALRAFFNVCAHAGSCLVGPWTRGERISPALVGKYARGVEHRRFKCPYHGWEYDTHGKLIKATNVRGMKDFKTRSFDLRPIRIRSLGPIAFLNFGEERDDDDATKKKDEAFVENSRLLGDRLTSSGYQGDLKDVELVETRSYTLKCNWKLFADNYGDGCYHCSYAHPDLSSSINESNYGTELLSSELSVQHAPFKEEVSPNERLGSSRPGVYAYWYPNIMVNRYGPWLDVDVIIPLDDTSCVVQKSWFLERDFATSGREGFVRTSLRESTAVHDEDVFLCENAQRGMSSRGYDSSRYVPSKQVAAHHFHRRLARDLTDELARGEKTAYSY